MGVAECLFALGSCCEGASGGLGRGCALFVFVLGSCCEGARACSSGVGMLG